MADSNKPQPGKPLAMVLGALALVTLIAWLLVGYAGCRHAGLV